MIQASPQDASLSEDGHKQHRLFLGRRHPKIYSREEMFPGQARVLEIAGLDRIRISEHKSEIKTLFVHGHFFPLSDRRCLTIFYLLPKVLS